MNDAVGYTECVNPATGEVLGRVPLHGVADIRRAVANGRAAQPDWAARPIAVRVRHLMRVRDYLADNADELADVISRDNGKTRLDALAAEVLPATVAVDYYCRTAARFLKDRRIRPGTLLLANKAAKVVRVPWGVVGIISPWNYPFSIPFSEVIMALLAGNAVVLKAAGETQWVARALNRCLAAADLPPGIFNQVNVPGRTAGPAFLEAGVNKLFFTGSTAVGKSLMQKAADTLTPLVLELGGNDPMLVCPDADLQRAAAGAVWAGLQNCGQSCGGVERIYVHRSVYEPFLEDLARRVRGLRVGYDTNYQVDLGAMTTVKQQAEVQRQIDAALAAGAQIYVQSAIPHSPPGNFMPAVVLTHVTHDMDIMKLETFGPVLAVMPVADMDEAVVLANDSDLGLTASVWTAHAGNGERLARRIDAGVVTINDHLMTHGLAETPWGGFKHSGVGRTHGEIGMAEMTQVQCLVHDYMPKVKKNLWWHPHGPEVYRGLRGMLDVLYGRGLWRRMAGMKALMRVFARTFKND